MTMRFQSARGYAGKLKRGMSTEQHLISHAVADVKKLLRQTTQTTSGVLLDLLQVGCGCGSPTPHPDNHFGVMLIGPFPSREEVLTAIKDMAGKVDEIRAHDDSLKERMPLVSDAEQ